MSSACVQGPEHDEDDSGRSTGSDDSSAASEGSAEKDTSSVQQQEAELGTKRLQDLSEDDFEPDEALQEPRLDVEELVQNWLTAPDDGQLKGPPLRCRCCPGTLLLNATSLKTHISSKRHQKNQKLREDHPQPICLAEDLDGDNTEDAETHAERLQRLRKVSAPPDLSGLSVSQKRKLMRKLKAEQRKKAALHRPGKRQRAEMKAEVFQAGPGEKVQKSAVSKKASKTQDTRGKKNRVQNSGIRKEAKKSKT